MLEDIRKAINYNLRKRNRLWEQQQIPWGYLDAGSKKFAIHTAAYQGDVGLKADGMLGPMTLAKILGKAKKVEKESRILLGGKTVEISEELQKIGLHHAEMFKAKKRKESPIHIVIHESVTRSREKCVEVLQKKELGVHFMIDYDGKVYQHCDPLKDAPAHANQLNSSSIGIEIINPYYPHLWGDPWIVLEPDQWWTHNKRGGEKGWVAPTEKQIQSCRELVIWLCENIESLPLCFPTKELGPRKTRIKGWKDREKPEAGIVAHRDFASHADGRGILERLFDLERN
jgi:hypothetical protein